MTKKRILNVTSRKKRNGMLAVTNTSATGSSVGVSQQPLTVNGALGAWVFWAATAQDFTTQTNGIGTVVEAATRTSQTCYMRGLSEHLRIQTSSAIPWIWRRVCFTIRSGTPSFRAWNASDTAPTNLAGPYWDGSQGVQRLMFNSNVGSVTNTVIQQQNLIFKGQSGVDWTDVTIAPLDTSRITVKYDKCRIIRSGNQSGTLKEMKLWHGMNKNLVYDDDENGSTETPSYWSTPGKAGMGDYYVVDMIQPGTGGTSTDYMQIACNSTLYWHEK